MWVIKVKEKELYSCSKKRSKFPSLVDLSKAKTYLSDRAARKSLNSFDNKNYPGYLKDHIGYDMKDFELVEIK